MKITVSQIRKCLSTINDPEIGYNLVELGLIYDIMISPPLNKPVIIINMTLTSPTCPMGSYFIRQIKQAVANVTHLSQENITVNLTFDPPWSPDALSDELKIELGFI